LRIIHDRLDALLHPSLRTDVLMRARPRAFMAPRLLGSLAALAAFPVYLAINGAPTGLEAAVFAWLIVPILLSWFLSRTGRYEAAHVLSSLALAGLVMMLALSSGGMESFAAVWLVVIPVEAALSASRRVVAFACALVLSCIALLLAIGYFELLPAPDPSSLLGGTFISFAVASASIYAGGLAFAAESLARTSLKILNTEKEKYLLLAHDTDDVISRHRRDGAVQFISPGVEKMLGTHFTRLLGHGLFDRVHVADRPAYLMALSGAAHGETRHVEFRVKREAVRQDEQDHHSHADFIWVEMRCRPFEQEGSAGAATRDVVTVMRDVTGRKQQEQSLAVARRAAEEADGAKDRFLATVSHELRTPLNAIIGFSEMIAQEEVLMLDARRRKEYAKSINDSGQYLLSVVNGILDISKMEFGHFEIVPEPFEPRAALIDCCAVLSLKAVENGIDLVTRVPEDLPSIIGDPRAFRRVVLNLVSNAIKFTERGGKVTVSAGLDGSRLVLRVTDTGVGIAADDLKRIGKPFFQVGNAYQRHREGPGLGLSIVKGLVTLHGGDLIVQSKLDEGTVVKVTLPLTFTPVALRPNSEPAGNIATLTPASRLSTQHYPRQVKRSA
jgi:two-component system, cell cycle sensor histidine kinase DivJ